MLPFVCRIDPSSLRTIIELITCYIGLTIPIAFGIALLAFFWSIFQLFGKIDSVDKRAEGRTMLIWSLIALFVIASLGGIVAIFQSTFPDLRTALDPVFTLVSALSTS